MEYIYLTITNLINFFLKAFFQGGFLFSMPLSQLVICTIIKLICVLIAVAYFTIAERKGYGFYSTSKRSYMLVGFWGLLQPLADGGKLLFKELIIPGRTSSIIFLVAPLMVLILSIVGWTVIPAISNIPDNNYLFKNYNDLVSNSSSNFQIYNNNSLFEKIKPFFKIIYEAYCKVGSSIFNFLFYSFSKNFERLNCWLQQIYVIVYYLFLLFQD